MEGGGKDGGGEKGNGDNGLVEKSGEEWKQGVWQREGGKGLDKRRIRQCGGKGRKGNGKWILLLVGD